MEAVEKVEILFQDKESHSREMNQEDLCLKLVQLLILIYKFK